MRTKNLISKMLPFLVGSFLLIACEKDAEKTPVMLTAEDDAISELVFEDIFSEVEYAMNEMESLLFDGMKKSASVVTCKTITVEKPADTISWPRTITIDYGEGCTGPKGVVRKGKIITVVNQGKFWLSGYSRTVTFEDYYVDGLKIEGSKTITNQGKNDAGNIVFSEVLTGGKVITPDSKEFTRQFERQREWVAGSSTPRLRIDDEYLVTGEASGINRKGIAYTRTITNPLHIKLSCRWIVSGTILIQAEGMPAAILDYGDGECDRKATVTIDDVVKNILLHR